MPLSNEVAALIGAGVGGALTLAGTLITSAFEARRWQQEDRKRDAEWRREKCNEAYSQAVYYLFKLQVSSRSADPSDKDVRQHLSEAQRYLSLLQAYHPSEQVRKELRRVAVELTDSTKTDDAKISELAEKALGLVNKSLQETWGPSIRP